MRKTIMLFTAAFLSFSACFTAFAGEWRQENNSWRYYNDNSTYTTDGWNWIDGKCYYFTAEGYCLIDTTTPDGYQVDASGAWIVDGVVQTQQTEAAQTEVVQAAVYTIGSMTITCPDNFRQYEQEENTLALISYDQKQAIGFRCGSLDYDPTLYLSEGDINTIVDLTLIEHYGAYSAKTTVQVTSGTWTRYDYPIDHEGAMTIYFRFRGPDMEVVIFAGDFSATSTDYMLDTYVR